MAIKLVNLSGPGMEVRRPEPIAKAKRTTNVLPEYQGMGVVERARKAANKASDNGRCWWIYDYIYRELTWRDKK